MSNDQGPNFLRRGAQSATVITAMIVAIIYLINPTAGILEFIPDNLPIVGNLDEAAALYILFSGLRFYGINLPNPFGRMPSRKEKRAESPDDFVIVESPPEDEN